MKKKLIFILLAILAVVCIFSACGGSTDTDTNTDTATDSGSACVHDWKFTSGTVTCTTGGDATYTCSLCQATKSETGVVALGHDWVLSSTIQPTCVASGYEVYSCARTTCNETQNRNEKKPNLSYHAYTVARVEPTCLETGTSESFCDYCEASKGDREILAALGHTYERTYEEGVTDPTTVVNDKPTCVENGKITKTCADCATVLELTYKSLTDETATEEQKALAETIKAFGHDHSRIVESKKADCETDGYQIKACVNEGCTDQIRTAETPKLGHTYARAGAVNFKYKVVLEPTCISAGKEWAICEDCAYIASKDAQPVVSYSRDIPATGEHDYSKKGSPIAPTCFREGYTEYFCTTEKCTASIKKDKTDIIDHNWELVTKDLQQVDGKWVATCKTEGKYPYVCKNYGCGATGDNKKEEPFVTIRHTYEKGNYVENPTCIKNAMYLCSACDTKFEAYPDDNAALATGHHDFSKVEFAETVAPTCTSYGYIKYPCSADPDCTAMDCKEIEARAPHKFDSISSDGKTTCSACQAPFINIKTEIVTEFKDEDDKVIVETEGSRLCDYYCTGENCSIHNIIIQITASTSPGPATPIESGEGENATYATELKVPSGKPISILQLKGSYNTTYTIELLDKGGNKITSFKQEINGVMEDVNIKFETAKDDAGTMFVDISEVANDVATIKITASSAGASVNYYTIDK